MMGIRSTYFAKGHSKTMESTGDAYAIACRRDSQELCPLPSVLAVQIAKCGPFPRALASLVIKAGVKLPRRRPWDLAILSLARMISTLLPSFLNAANLNWFMQCDQNKIRRPLPMMTKMVWDLLKR